MQNALSVFAETPQNILYGYGPLGIFVVALSWFSWKLITMFMQDRDRVIGQRDSLLKDIFEKVIPAITRNTEVLQARQEIDKELVVAIRESNAALDRNTKAFEEVRDAYRYGRPSNRGGGG